MCILNCFPEHVPLVSVLIIHCMPITSMSILLVKAVKAIGSHVSGAPHAILAYGIPHFACRIRPTDDRDTTPRALPGGGPNALLANM